MPTLKKSLLRNEVAAALGTVDDEGVLRAALMLLTISDRSGTDEFTLRDEANVLTACAFRNGPLEALHAGKYSLLVEDPANSRITNDEMRELMINASAQLERLLYLKASDPAAYAVFLREYHDAYCCRWDRASTTPPPAASTLPRASGASVSSATK